MTNTIGFSVSALSLAAAATAIFLGPQSYAGQPALRPLEPIPADPRFGGTGGVSIDNSGQTALLFSIYGGVALVNTTSSQIEVDLTGISLEHRLLGVSGDGNVVMAETIQGLAQRVIPERYVRGVGLERLDGFVDDGGEVHPQGVSADGSVIVGYAVNSSVFGGAFRWRAGSGVEYFNGSAFNSNFSSASSVSADGSSVLVTRSLQNGPSTLSVWRGGLDNTDLEADPLGRNPSSFALNRNGTRAVSLLSVRNVSPAVPVALGFWDASGQLTSIDGPAGFDFALLTAANSDATMIGMYLTTPDFRPAAYLWSAESGFIDINQLLRTLQLSLPSWPGDSVIRTITGISDDGRTIVGRLYGDVPYVLTIPSPTTGVLIGGMLLFGARRRRVS